MTGQPERAQPTVLLAEAHTLLRVCAAINRLLGALLAISHGQLALRDDPAWQQLLQRKQTLLDELEALNPGRPVHQARQLAARLLAAEQWDAAAQLQEAVGSMHERFVTLLACEQTAERQLQQQVDALRETLYTEQRRQSAHSAYQDGTARRRSRFVNAVQ